MTGDAGRAVTTEDVRRGLRAAFPEGGDEDAVEAARAVGRRAEREGLVDVAYAVVESPVGTLLAAGTAGGLIRLAYADGGIEPILVSLSARVSPRILEVPVRLDPIRRQLDEYFERRRRHFDMPIDWTLVRGFGRRVLEATAAIPYGSVATYREVAEEAGSPRAVRATGNALGANPLPIVIPCHRVLRTGGGLGGYGGGLARKQSLLDLEGVEDRRTTARR